MKILGAATGLGARDVAAGAGAEFVFRNNLQLQLFWHKTIKTAALREISDFSTGEKINYLFPFFNRVTREIKNLIKNNHFPLVIGGDHSCAIGTWRALLETSNKDFGLLWLDAHLDAHTFRTTPSQAIHGMPLACLLGYGDDKFLPKKVLEPQNVVVFGARSWEDGERELLDFIGVRIYEMEEINDRGLKLCFDEALSIVSKETIDFGISLDLDMFDPDMVSGVCSREKNGIDPIEFYKVFKDANVVNKENLKGFEIVEFAPDRDNDGMTYKTLLNYVNLFLEK